MRLDRLEISGFKSFSDRSELAFDKGVTAIVGPNGCGKSNVADAITWVLGEQSAKSLRGDKMEDVIFNGSDARKPSATAEVRLRFSGVVKSVSGPVFNSSSRVVSRTAAAQTDAGALAEMDASADADGGVAVLEPPVAGWYEPQNLLEFLHGTGSTLTTYVYFASPAGEGNAEGKAYGAALVLFALVFIVNIVLGRLGQRKLGR